MKKVALLHRQISLHAFSIAVTASALLPVLAQADRTSEIAAQLRQFGANPAAAMAKLPRKFDAVTGAPAPGYSLFGADQVASGDFVTLKDSYRQHLCTSVGGARVCLSNVLPGRAPFEENDLAENLVDNGDSMIRTLTEMQTKHLENAALAETPWSDTYWPIYDGQVATRYADSAFPNSSDWEKNKKYVEEHDFLSIFKTGDVRAIDDLSPAEKYDLLVGDEQGTLAASNWAVGESYFKESGKVEDWMGICHGWSPASYMVPRPKHTVQVMAADGKTTLTFYPADIKGLASLMWSKNNKSTRMIGGRCNQKHPKVNKEGRIIDPDCFDTNPGTWHMAVVNQIGVSKRSMVIDATYDYQVWNQPVYSYSYTYFNPQTRQPAPDLASAKVSMKDFSEDKFQKFRSKEAVAAVGIAMDLTYIQETNPAHDATNSPANDSPKLVRYMYDLELNAQGEIVGGEWYERAHPDFIWTPAPDDRVVTSGDRFATGEWKVQGSMPENWQKAAAKTSAAVGSPLAKIVDVLTSLAHE